MPLKPHPTDPEKMVYVSREYKLPKPWVGLTNEEMMQIYVELKSVVGFYSVEKYARAIENALRSKNT